MRFKIFSAVKLAKDLPEYNLYQGTTAIIVDRCPRPDGQEEGYVLEVLDQQALAIYLKLTPS